MSILRLKELLKEKGITGKELAERVDLSITGMSNIVKGESIPKPDTLTSIAKELDVDIRDLFHSTKETETETLYVNRDGNYIPVGSINKIK